MSIAVHLSERSYDIVVARSYAALPEAMRALGLSGQGWVVSHASLLRRYGRALLTPLRRAGWELQTVTVPETERSKSLQVAERLIQQLAQHATMRPPVILAFGGGVVGDVAGFVAAVYRRGIPYVQVPTTLLAQVDSAIGGKVGLDLVEGKNLVGAFYQPRVVWNNLSVLRSLPPRQRRSGMAEVIKYGVIADAALFSYLEERMSECLALGGASVQRIVTRACQIKARVVAQDERETNTRRLHLNFGHTLGHALEAATGYRRWTHGEAIAIGMCAAAQLSVETNRMRGEDFERLVRVIQAAGLPIRATRVSRAAVLNALRYDKKFIHGRPRWVLPTQIGRVIVSEAVPETVVRRVLSHYVPD